MILGIVAIPLVFGLGGSWLGGTIIGGTLGASIGGVAGSLLGSTLFPQKADKITLPKLSSFPIQSTVVGSVIPIVYGRARIAGNIIYVGTVHPYTITTEGEGGGKGGGASSPDVAETRYKRSFLVALCEGPADVTGIWAGKNSKSLSVCTIFPGDGNVGLSTVVGKEFAKYKNICCAWFDEYDLGNTGAIPSFTFEVNTYPVNYEPEMEVPFVVSGQLGAETYSSYIFNDGGQIVCGLTASFGGTIKTAKACLKHLNGYIYVCCEDRLVKFDSDGNLVTAFGTGGSIQLCYSMLYDMCVDISGYIYVVGNSGTVAANTVYKIDPDTGSAVWGAHLVSSKIMQGCCIATYDNKLYVVGELNKVFKFDPSTGNLITTYTALGYTGTLEKVKVNDFGTIYACGSYPDNLWRFKQDGTLIGGASVGHSDLKDLSVLCGAFSTQDVIFCCGDYNATDDCDIWAVTTTFASLRYIPGIHLYIQEEGRYKSGGDSKRTIFDNDGRLLVLHTKGIDQGGHLAHITKLTIDLAYFSHWLLEKDQTWEGISRLTSLATGKSDGWYPVDIVKDMIVNTQYGASLSSEYIHQATYNEVRQICIDNNIKISITLDTQKPLLDWVDYVNSHYCGYLYMGG